MQWEIGCLVGHLSPQFSSDIYLYVYIYVNYLTKHVYGLHVFMYVCVHKCAYIYTSKRVACVLFCVASVLCVAKTLRFTVFHVSQWLSSLKSRCTVCFVGWL